MSVDPKSPKEDEEDDAEYTIKQLAESGTNYGLKTVGGADSDCLLHCSQYCSRQREESDRQEGGKDEPIVSFVDNLAYAAAMVFVIVAASAKPEVQTTWFVMVLCAAGFAMGLALQG